MRSNTPVTEPMAVPDVFVSGLHSIEDIGGGCVRRTYYVNQTNPHDGEPERVICLRIIAPKEAVEPTMPAVAKAVGWQLVGEIGPVRPNDMN